MAIRTHLTFLLCLVTCCSTAWCQDLPSSSPAYKVVSNILYRSDNNLTDYMRAQCRLDLYYPTQIKDFPTVVWFHGGGLKAGKRAIPQPLQEQGIAVVAVSGAGAVTASIRGEAPVLLLGLMMGLMLPQLMAPRRAR